VSVTLGTGHIEDDSWLGVVGWWIEFFVDSGEGAEEQVTGVGHDGRAARGDAVLRLETKEAGEEFVDGDSGIEFGKIGDEFGGKVGGLSPLLLTAGMVGAEGGEGIRDGHAAATLAGVALAAVIRRSCEYRRYVDRIGVSRCVAHDVPRFSEK
jgi:hypothetical protein